MMIKRDDLKYLYFGEDVPEVLFDLASDPGDLTNALDQPAHAEALAAFRARRDTLGYPR
jgi:choline-sulfatase